MDWQGEVQVKCVFAEVLHKKCWENGTTAVHLRHPDLIRNEPDKLQQPVQVQHKHSEKGEPEHPQAHPRAILHQLVADRADQEDPPNAAVYIHVFQRFRKHVIGAGVKLEIQASSRDDLPAFSAERLVPELPFAQVDQIDRGEDRAAAGADHLIDLQQIV